MQGQTDYYVDKWEVLRVGVVFVGMEGLQRNA